MKKKYEEPQVTITKFSCEDVIATSGNIEEVGPDE